MAHFNYDTAFKRANNKNYDNKEEHKAEHASYVNM